MRRVSLAIGLICIMGGVGFYIGKYYKPSKSEVAAVVIENETLYKLPLGRFTVQVVKPSRFFNIRFNMDVFITGAANFERMNGGLSRNQMREDVIRHLSNIVETTLWVEENNRSVIDENELAMTVARKLYQTYPMVRSAQISDLATSRVER